VSRGEIWWTDFGQPFGSEPGYRRPALVVQADSFNRSRLATVLVVPLSRNLELAAAPGNVLCRPRDTGLPKASVANVSQLTVTDRRRLVEKAGSIPGLLLKEVESGLRLVLGL
jgi:mRNA interferase MazF